MMEITLDDEMRSEFRRASLFCKAENVVLKEPETIPTLGPPKVAKLCTLVLDLDRTLIFGGKVKALNADVVRQSKGEPDETFALLSPVTGQRRDMWLWYRPGLLPFLRTAAEFCEIVSLVLEGKIMSRLSLKR
jgi:NLI interacting factor-like phosphatase